MSRELIRFWGQWSCFAAWDPEEEVRSYFFINVGSGSFRPSVRILFMLPLKRNLFCQFFFYLHSSCYFIFVVFYSNVKTVGSCGPLVSNKEVTSCVRALMVEICWNLLPCNFTSVAEKSHD